MPMNRSRVRTRQAMISENVANPAAPRTTTTATPKIGTSPSWRWTPIRAATMYTTTACTSARNPPASAFPETRARRDAGLTRYLWRTPRSRSQITAMPKKIAEKSALWASTPGARKSM